MLPETLKGWRTVITNSVFFLAALASMFGVVVPEDESTAVVAGAMALLNIGLRFVTTTKVGSKE